MRFMTSALIFTVSAVFDSIESSSQKRGASASQAFQPNEPSDNEISIIELIMNDPILITTMPADAPTGLQILFRKIGNAYESCTEGTDLAITGPIFFGWVDSGKIAPLYKEPNVPGIYSMIHHAQGIMSLPALRILGVGEDATPPIDYEYALATVSASTTHPSFPGPGVRRLVALVNLRQARLTHQNSSGSSSRHPTRYWKNNRN